MTEEINATDEFIAEVWQLEEISNHFWATSSHSSNVRKSIVDQIKIITWSRDDGISYSAIWLNCNRPIMELRRRIVRPAVTIEKKDGSGWVTTPTEYFPYRDIIRTSEGCSFLPPIHDKADPNLIEKRLLALFETAKRVRNKDTIKYFDTEGAVIAQFENIPDPYQEKK